MNPTVAAWLAANQSKFTPEDLAMIRSRLETLDEQKAIPLSAVPLKDPTTALLISIFVGYLGIDRFYTGDTGLGVLKLLTGGLCGIMALIDWFLIMGVAKKKNAAAVMPYL